MSEQNCENVNPYSWFPTPDPLTDFLCREVERYSDLSQQLIYEPCAGAGDISSVLERRYGRRPIEADLDPRWGLTVCDATVPYIEQAPDWVITNPAFDVAFGVIEQALAAATRGVAIYHRCTLMEPLKTEGYGRSFFREHVPTMTLWCPRWAHQRSEKTGKWATDNATCVWSVWLQDYRGPHIGNIWPPDSLFPALKAFTKQHQNHVDKQMSILAGHALPAPVSPGLARSRPVTRNRV